MVIARDEDRVRAEWWTGAGDGVLENVPALAYLEVERDEGGAGRVSIHTMVTNGEGSKASYYLDRESAIELAAKLLNVVRLP